ncbi:MAG: ATP-grasp domain-containing protein [Phycisphaerales bacterium]|nr:ATP-grasp domain-containing protein [Phycisphaerales bacterium]
MKKIRVLALMDKDLVPPDSIDDLTDEQLAPFKTEYDVTAALYELGHEVSPLGVGSDLGVIRHTIEECKPHIVFNLLEEFSGEAVFDQNVVSYLELLRLPYTGCNPRGMLLARDKALSKQILSFHRIRVPDFAVFPRGRAIKRPRKLQFPLIVKSLIEEASLGISKASVVDDDNRLTERVRFIHNSIGTDAIAEKFIEGRELYVGMVGNHRLQLFPIWELRFTNASEDTPLIATAKVKWDYKYQKKLGVQTSEAKDLEPATAEHIRKMCKRIYRCLGMCGYARIDLRMDNEGRVYVLEANPNPQLAYGEDFAESAHAGGVEYNQLVQRIITLGLRRGRERP